MSRFCFKGSTSWKRQPGVANILGKRSGSAEGVVHKQFAANGMGK